MLQADFDHSTGIFAIHDAHVNKVEEGAAHSRADALCMIKILCNTLGINFAKLYNTATCTTDALAAARTASTDLAGVLNRGTNQGFQTVQIAEGTLTQNNLDPVDD